jgi:hypothetical protein
MAKKCSMCNQKLKGYSNLSINYQYGFGSRYDGDRLLLNLCPCCIDKITHYIVINSSNNPIVEI